ncbi:MAG TPA: phosphohistidine phosphatase SixA [Anaerolineales bacterium]|nr:phosphohistidine phosphatase SixA [Anaerolineales bacterium]
MKIYLVRHSNAVQAGTPGYEDDSARPLTKQGRAKMRRIAAALRKLGLKPALIVSSPYVRARETAEILAKMVKYGEDLVFSETLVPMGNPEDIIAEITEKYSVDELVLVGHEPCLSTLMGALIAGNQNPAISLKKGGVGCLSTDHLSESRTAVLEWLLTPKILSRLS